MPTTKVPHRVKLLKGQRYRGPVWYQGVVYASVKVAALDLAISRVRVSQCLRLGYHRSAPIYPKIHTVKRRANISALS